MSRRIPLALLALTLTAPACTRGGGGGGGSGTGPDAVDIDISRVELYQGVAVALMEDGDEAPPGRAPVVRGREALFRVWVEPAGGFEEREIEARLTVYDEDTRLGTYTATMEVEGDTEDGELDTSFNFVVPGEEIVPELEYEVSLHEAGGSAPDGDLRRHRWPEDAGDTQSVDVWDAGDKIRVTIVPIRYRADGSNRLPDTSPAQMQIIRDHMNAQYPAPLVELTVTDPYDYSGWIGAGGGGIDGLLAEMADYRQRGPFDFEEYVYAMVNPSETYYDYCGGGCTAGISLLGPDAGSDWARVSVGIGFPGEGTATTMAHEIGHAHGRSHAPCNVAGEGGYPHSGGRIGVWGYDRTTETLIGPNTADFMGYCDPTWISDYTFNGLFERARAVNGARSYHLPDDYPRTWRLVAVLADGSVRWGSTLRPTAPVAGPEVEVDLLDAAGGVVRSERARLVPFSHLDGGILVLPEPEEEVVSLQPLDRTLLLR